MPWLNPQVEADSVNLFASAVHAHNAEKIWVASVSGPRGSIRQCRQRHFCEGHEVIRFCKGSLLLVSVSVRGV